jgi:hypothetical protein
VRGRGRRELGLDLRDLQPAQERVVGVALEEPPAEGVEQDDADAVVRPREQPLDLQRDVGEGADAGTLALAAA